MKFAIIGCGSIGSRHARNLITLGHEVYVSDTLPSREEALAGELKCGIYDFKVPVAAWVICAPPAAHLTIINEAISRNIHVFVEKPISHTMDGVGDMLERANEAGLCVAAGYQLRFDSGLLKMKEMIGAGDIGEILHVSAEYGNNLSKWHPYEDYRKLYTARREMGGGIILDASHEIDYVRWLLGDNYHPVILSCFANKYSNLDIDVEDSADIMITYYRHSNHKVSVNIHVDMNQQVPTRWCKVVGSEGNLIWSRDYNGFILLNCTMIPVDKNDPYIDEMKVFIDRVQKGPAIIDRGAVETLMIATAALRAQNCMVVPL